MQQTNHRNQFESKLKTLEKNLQVPLFDLDRSVGESKSDELVGFIQALSCNTGFGVLLRIDTDSNIIKKTLSLLLISLRIWILKLKLKRYGGVVGRFCIYPSIEEPVTIYEAGTPAEHYVNQFVLPALPHGVNGKVRKLIMVLARCHPSSAGMVLVVRKN